MGTSFRSSTLLLLLVLTNSFCHSELQPSSETQTLLTIQSLLGYPDVLSSWKNKTDFCNIEPTSSVTVVCYEGSITQLHIIGEKRAPPLPRNFSTPLFVNTLVKLPSLKVLTLVSLGLRGQLPGSISGLTSLEILNISTNFFQGVIPQEISSLTNLQTLILDDNLFHGRIPDELSSLSLLAVLSMKKNLLNGSMPELFGNLENLRVLDLSRNKLTGSVPNIRRLTNLQVLQLGDNFLGPQFPQIGSKKIITLVLRRNKFHSAIPDEVSSFNQLQIIDLSFNKFVGRFPPSLFSLPSVSYLNIGENRFTGILSVDMACNAALKLVDLSGNLLSGSLPNCLLSDPKNRVVISANNCLANGERSQHAISFCSTEALAVGIIPHHQKKRQASKMVLALSVSGGIIGVIIIVALVFLALRRVRGTRIVKSPPDRSMKEKASTGNSNLHPDARYTSRAMKLGALGVPAYRTYSLKELEDATNNFDTSAFINDGPYSQMYKGQLKDGMVIAIRCLKMKKSHSTQRFMHHIELISKLRNQNLVSALGHCFECYLDDSSVSRIFLVFEYVPHGTLRDWLSVRSNRKRLTWSRRISAAIGVAKGIQFLHTGIVPGVFTNNLKITDILLDQNLVAKIGSHNLPIIAQNMGKVGSQRRSKEVDATRIQYQEKSDIKDLGVILLEIIVGRNISTQNDVEIVMDQLQASLTADSAARKSMIDPAVRNAYSDESLKTMMEISSRCMLKNPADRPSLEDVLWNLRFAVQVQDSSQSSDASPDSPFRTSVPWH
ncbi:hypothetical protein ACET3Z_016031 [Daucus carota]